jgi:hypothetical protein
MEISLGHPYAPMATVVALSMASLSPCYYLVGALKGTIKKCRDSDASRLTGVRQYGKRTSSACGTQYRQKARLSSRPSLKPERRCRDGERGGPRPSQSMALRRE